MQTVVLIGKPASGKGTQAHIVADDLGYLHLSVGQLYRQHIAQQSALGMKVEEFVTNGLLVPNAITNSVIEEQLISYEGKGIVFDGYPRTLEQVQGLGEVLWELESTLHLALNIEISDGMVLERITGRRICTTNQGHIFHTETHPPKQEGICDFCGGVLIQREDDGEESAKERLELFHQETDPVIDYYDKQGILHTLNGERDIESITKDILRLIDEFN